MNLGSPFLLKSDGPRPEPRSEHSQPAPTDALDGTMQELIDDLPEEIALLDEQCNILAINRAWRETVEEHGYLDAIPGYNYLSLCMRRAAEGYGPAVEAASALQDISSGKRSFWQMIYNGGDLWDGHDYQICAHRIGVGPQTVISVTRFDLTEIMALRRAKDDLRHSLVESQSIERQRLARELHDSTSQLLAGIGLLLGRLEHQSPNRESLGLVEELQELVREAQQEIRSISYLAHPPSIERLGFAGAMKSLVEGFARRAGFEGSFEVTGEMRSLSSEKQGALYRIVQEALSNVHRHARATRVRVQLCFRHSVHVMIADDGVGISDDTLKGLGNAGVGLSSMSERLTEIGGRLSLRRLSPGTAIIATV